MSIFRLSYRDPDARKTISKGIKKAQVRLSRSVALRDGIPSFVFAEAKILLIFELQVFCLQFASIFFAIVLRERGIKIALLTWVVWRAGGF